MQRRQWLARTAATIALPALRPALAAVPGITDREILLGQSVVLSGPLGGSLKSFNDGARIAFEQVNKQGGVNGRQIRVITLDDELKPDRAVANYRKLLDEDKVFAFFGGVGSATISAVTPLLREANVPLIGNYAVADAVREKAKGAAYFVRATYGREAEKLVQHLATVGITRIAVAHLANPGGEEVLALVRKAIQANGQAQDVAAAAGVKNDGSNTEEAAKALAAAQPQAVIMFLSGPPVAQLMQTMWAAGANPAFYGMSTVAGDQVAKALGDKLRSLAITQVVPYPWSESDAQAIAFREKCRAANLDVSYWNWEGFINAQVMIEALKRSGREPTRESLHATMRGLKMRVAGMDLDFTGGQATGSRFIEPVLVTSSGRFRR